MPPMNPALLQDDTFIDSGRAEPDGDTRITEAGVTRVTEANVTRVLEAPPV